MFSKGLRPHSLLGNGSYLAGHSKALSGYRRPESRVEAVALNPVVSTDSSPNDSCPLWAVIMLSFVESSYTRIALFRMRSLGIFL